MNDDDVPRFTVETVPSPMLQTILHIRDWSTDREFLSVASTQGGVAIIKITPKKEVK